MDFIVENQNEIAICVFPIKIIPDWVNTYPPYYGKGSLFESHWVFLDQSSQVSYALKVSYELLMHTPTNILLKIYIVYVLVSRFLAMVYILILHSSLKGLWHNNFLLYF